jgi:hypothetical protein
LFERPHEALLVVKANIAGDLLDGARGAYEALDRDVPPYFVLQHLERGSFFPEPTVQRAE